jgi:hypothetical protein
MGRFRIGDRSISSDEIQDLLATDHPMVARFQFEETRGHRGPESLAFALRIIARRGVRYLQQRDRRGARITPAWRTLSGDERIGEGNRAIWREGDALVAENCTFFPHQEFNDLGIGSALYVSMERFYRELGIRRVSLFAVDVGIYVWARQGFAFEARSLVAELEPELERYRREHGATAPLDRAILAESWDFANHDLSGVRVDGDRLGKAFMLTRAPPWHGLKRLGDERHDRVAEASRRETFARLPAKIEGAPGELAVR